MGRELRRKEAKRNGKNVRDIQKLSKEKPMTMKQFITIIVVLLVFFVILYILTGIFITKDIKWFDKKDTTTDNVSTISNKILGVDSLRQSEEEYYVYYYDTTNENSDVTSTINSLTTKVYKVDLHDAFNARYIRIKSSRPYSNQSSKQYYYRVLYRSRTNNYHFKIKNKGGNYAKIIFRL